MDLAQRWRKWLPQVLAEFPKTPPENMAQAQAALEAFEAARGKTDPTVDELQPIVDAACSPRKLVFEAGTDFLVFLARDSNAAQGCLLSMARHKSATARFNAVASLEPCLPGRLIREIIELGLKDRSSKVRWMAVQQTESLRMSELLPTLESMQQSEADEKVLESLSFHIPLLRDGFFVRENGKGDGYYLTIRGPDGSVGGPFISNEDYSQEFVENEIARFIAMCKRYMEMPGG
jgi:hypothetical protein